MRKVISILLILAMGVALVSCSNGGDDQSEAGTQSKDPIQEVAATYGLDLESTEQQQMSTERATAEQLGNAMHGYLKDVTYFGYDPDEKITYADLKAQIGFDATVYYAESGKQSFLWLASDDSTAKFLATFVDGLLYAVGSVNI